ncbi:glycosyltransferase family 2 protein [Aeromicrobium sp. CF3.5]|uniref:glycosyltransferase family 2 protein n=1 Tax=Aeromicrobium sp. CF3.5 TaxID=3373078 RepID=UPI003EE80CB8
MSLVIGAIVWTFIGYSALINTSFLLLTLAAARDFVRHVRRVEFSGYDITFAGAVAPSVSVLVPAYDESASIVESVRALASLRYPQYEVVVIDDGSSDGTSDRLIEAFDMVPAPIVVSSGIPTNGAVVGTYLSRQGSHNVLLVRKENGGKADALNVGVNAARMELVCMVDADSILDQDALLHVARPFVEDPEHVMASGGMVRVANGSTVRDGRVTDVRMPRRWVERAQVVEYLRAFTIGRAGWSAVRGLLIISGAFGLFRRDVVQEIGGLDPTCIGEDAELVVRLHRWLYDHDVPGRVVFVPEPVAWTEAPGSRAVLRKQRRRWHRGLTEILTRHRGMIGRKRYGVVGMLAMPWFVLFELLAPLVEVAGFVAFVVIAGLWGAQELGWVDPTYVDGPTVVLLLAVSVLYATVLTWFALLIEELSFRRHRGLGDLLRAVRAGVEESFGYRQLNAVWRIGGAVEAVRKTRHDWGDMKRQGFGPP